jgi:hypothetical protein
MTDLPFVRHAELWELVAPDTRKSDSKVLVQFNPDTLKVSYSNQIAPPTNNNGSKAKKAQDQNGTATIQFVGKGTTKLSVQLWFDVSAPLPVGKEWVTDVRELTRDVVYFITPKPNGNAPPALRFLWGSFHFDGIVDSIEESLEFFSADGVPLRASVSISVSQQGVTLAPEVIPSPDSPAAPGSTLPGTRGLTPAASGQTLQELAAQLGQLGNWQAIASANGVDNPRLLSPGQLIDMGAPINT